MLLIFKAQQCYVRYDMHEKLKSSHATFELLTLTFEEYQNSRINSDEISIHGKMYDVKSVVISGDSIRLLAINDYEEENILEKIKNFIEKSDLPNSALPNQLHKLITLVYLQVTPEYLYYLPSHFIYIFHSLSASISSCDSDIPSPPPKLA